MARIAVAFVRQQRMLAPQAAAKTGERGVIADDAMAGDDDGNRIAAHGLRQGPDGARPADALRQLAVADGRPERQGQQAVPDRALEHRAARRQRQIEGAALAVEPLQ